MSPCRCIPAEGVARALADLRAYYDTQALGIVAATQIALVMDQLEAVLVDCRTSGE